MSIKILPQELINQIAAGEVVERPASVLKELVENSLDSGAKNIDIEIENGGINLIKVIDDGSGMDKEDAELSVVQHATSKIGSQADLYNIMSLGFRGEALASIFSVSEFELVTKKSDSIAGYKVRVDNSEVQVSETSAVDGTSVEIKNIFYNVPARKKYLKTVVTEFNHIVDLFLNYCLGYPNVAWKLEHNGKIVYQFPETDQKQRIADCLGEDISNNLIPVDLKLSGVRVFGFIGKPQIARNNRKLQYLFVNNRPVNEYIIAKQIKDAYSTLLSRDLYPVYILNIEVENEKVDVNVHPRKLEVRFSDPGIVYKSVYATVTQSLDENDLNHQISADDMKKFVPIKQVVQEKQQKFTVNSIRSKRDFISQSYTDPEFKKTAISFNQAMQKDVSMSAEAPDNEFVDEFKILGQVQNSYIVVETDASIKIYDQHATSERVQYEKIKREWQIGSLPSQKMLIPQNVELAPNEFNNLLANKELFDRLGFEVDDFGNNTISVSAVPLILARVNIRELILQIVGEITNDLIVEDKICEPIDKILKMMSCRSAIKFGDQLAEDGMKALIIDLEKLENKYTCVHGRPVMLEYKYQDLERLFKRKE